MDWQEKQQQMRALLLSYISLLAERNAFAPGDNFEYQLWDTLHGSFANTDYVTLEEGAEIVWLAVQTESWVTYDVDSRMFKLIAMDEWEELLSKRGH
jgi:hypothetical protein